MTQGAAIRSQRKAARRSMSASGRAAAWRSGGCHAASARGGGSYWSWPRACPRESGGFVDEHQALGVKPALVFLPLGPPAGDVGAVLFTGVQAFFKTDPFAFEKA